MKKKIIIICSIIIVIIILLVSLYFYGLTPVNKNKQNVEFNITTGMSKIDIIDKLASDKLIKSKFVGYIYVLLNRNLNLQAGNYELNDNMSLKDILKKINDGKIIEVKNTFNLTFIEGKRLNSYASIIAKETNTTEDEVLSLMSDKEFLQELIDKYWFITDEILNKDIYYPLEGYVFASTYELYNGSSVKDIIFKMLDGMQNVLNPLKEDIEASGYSVHEILTLASIVELEGARSTDRTGVAGVFYNRLKRGESLGSDVTTYYAVRKDFSEPLYLSEINNCQNGYNTRGTCNVGKLPVGPICSPSLESIKAVINPSKHDYLYFVADKNGKTYFMKTYSEHQAKVRELQASGLWFTYN